MVVKTPFYTTLVCPPLLQTRPKGSVTPGIGLLQGGHFLPGRYNADESPAVFKWLITNAMGDSPSNCHHLA